MAHQLEWPHLSQKVVVIILFIIYYQTKIVVVNEDEFTLDLFVVMYFSYYDVIDMHFLHVCWY
jgi:hypothetical protein